MTRDQKSSTHMAGGQRSAGRREGELSSSVGAGEPERKGSGPQMGKKDSRDSAASGLHRDGGGEDAWASCDPHGSLSSPDLPTR